MRRRSEKPPAAVGHTCLAIDQMRHVIRRSVAYGPDRDRVLGLLETLRAENQALRDRLVWFEEELAETQAELGKAQSHLSSRSGYQQRQEEAAHLDWEYAEMVGSLPEDPAERAAQLERERVAMQDALDGSQMTVRDLATRLQLEREKLSTCAFCGKQVRR